MTNPVQLSLEDNSFFIRYLLREHKHQMDAFVLTKCSQEFLAYAKELANILQVDISIETVALKEGSVLQHLIIKVRNGISQITPKDFGIFLLGLFTTSFNTCVNSCVTEIFKDRELAALNKENLRLEVLEKKQRIEESTKLRSRQSNFYEAALSDENITDIEYSTSANDGEKPITRTVNSSSFSSYVLNDRELDPVIIEDAQILIVSPVIVKTNRSIPWHGIYKGESISFKMESSEFKTKAQNGDISFKNGKGIICKLEILRSMNEQGEISKTRYIVKEVYGVTEMEMILETQEGRRRRLKKENDNAPHLFSAIGFE